MPEKRTIERARKKARQGRSPSTQAGEFVREEIHHVREGKHGARSPEQAIAIGLSKARRAGVNIPEKKGGRARASRGARIASPHPSARRSRAMLSALKDEPRSTASTSALSRQARRSAAERGGASRRRAARAAVRTKGRAERRRAARKAARTRASR